MERFIQKAYWKHGDRFDYSESEYIDCKTLIVIICPLHGRFEQKPQAHLTTKNPCLQCRKKQPAVFEQYNASLKAIERIKQIRKDVFARCEARHEGDGCNLCQRTFSEKCLHSVWLSRLKRIDCEGDICSLKKYKILLQSLPELRLSFEYYKDRKDTIDKKLATCIKKIEKIKHIICQSEI